MPVKQDMLDEMIYSSFGADDMPLSEWIIYRPMGGLMLHGYWCIGYNVNQTLHYSRVLLILMSAACSAAQYKQN